MKRDENKLITLVIDQSKMTKEQDKAWWDLIQQGWADETVLYMGRGNCTIDDESEVQGD